MLLRTQMDEAIDAKRVDVETHKLQTEETTAKPRYTIYRLAKILKGPQSGDAYSGGRPATTMSLRMKIKRTV